jgi:hypothetical protein
MEMMFLRSFLMELKTMMTRTVKTTSPRLRGLKLAALAIGASFVLAGCAGNPPTEQYAVTQSALAVPNTLQWK